MGLWRRYWSWYKGFYKKQMDGTKKRIERNKTDWENLKKEKDNFIDTVKETKEDLKKAKDEMKGAKEVFKEETKENWKETKENWKQAKSEWKDEENSMKDEEDVLVKGNFWKTLALFPFRLLISPLSLISYSVGYVLIDMRKNFQELAGDNWFFFYVFALVTGWVVAVPLALTFGFFRTLRYVITGRKIERPQSDYELKGQNTTVVRLEENVASELEKFAELKEKGIISEEEFVKKKEELLK